jgi:hypothetical protein
MNSKLLYAATVAISLISTLALADEAPGAKSRAEVRAELSAAIADHSLQRTDYDADARAAAGVSTKSRDQVRAELVADNRARRALAGPLANRTFNGAGVAILATSTLPRAEVKAEVLAAAANGTLHRTDYDDPLNVARPNARRVSGPSLAQRLKDVFARLHG